MSERFRPVIRRLREIAATLTHRGARVRSEPGDQTAASGGPLGDERELDAKLRELVHLIVLERAVSIGASAADIRAARIEVES